MTDSGSGDAPEAVAETYRRFARQEAHGRSAAYESLAEAVAAGPGVTAFAAALLSGEPPGAAAGAAGPAGAAGTATAAPGGDLDAVVVARDGHAVALADGHGTWLRWLGG